MNLSSIYIIQLVIIRHLATHVIYLACTTTQQHAMRCAPIEDKITCLCNYYITFYTTLIYPSTLVYRVLVIFYEICLS